jgi:uncharacterized protein (TIGR03067 family)
VLLADDGRKADADEVQRTRVTVAGNRYTLHLGGYEFHGIITGIEPTKDRGPVDFVGTAGRQGIGRRVPGIFILEGDELTVCVGPAGRARPTAFESRPGSGHRLYLLKRCGCSKVRTPEEALRF